ncbi:MAG: hypothetical protein V4708_01560 [Bacteroidota bacterium]
MKTTTIITSTLLLAVGLFSCRSKNLSILQNRNNSVQQGSSSLETRTKESNYNNRIIELSDSSDHQYKVRIFPLDNFSFSIDSGFKGKARSIEFSGSIRQKREASAMIADSAAKLTDQVYEQETRNSNREMTSAKAMTKKSTGIISFWIWIGFVILTVYGVGKFLKLNRRSEV